MIFSNSDYVIERLKQLLAEFRERNAVNPGNKSSTHGNAQAVEHANRQVECSSSLGNYVLKFIY